MTSSEDPEQRIADLERPLLQSAGESELPAGNPRAGLRLGWILLGLLVVGLIAGGAAILMGASGGPVAGHPTTPGALHEPGAGPAAPEPARAPSSPTAVGPIAPPQTRAAEPAPPPGVPISVAGVGNERTIDCADNAVSISGVNNRVVLNGHCTHVEVSGIENTVTVDAADEIAVSGLNNAVTYRSGAPELENSGMGNTVEKG